MIKYYDEILKVRLVSYSQPADIIGIEDVQDLIAYCAKVSNPKFQDDFSSSDTLLAYLIKHKHWSPFEMANAVLEITTTRDIARQALRHTSFRFQEFSQRYKEIDALEDSFAIKEARLQHPTNRQSSIELNVVENEKHAELNKAWLNKQRQIIHEAHLAYKWALENGIAKEQARIVLPEGNTVSRVYMNGTIRSWIHYVELRSGNGTQKEHMLLARECAKAINRIFPYVDI